jgi:hypothetical protein
LGAALEIVFSGFGDPGRFDCAIIPLGNSSREIGIVRLHVCGAVQQSIEKARHFPVIPLMSPRSTARITYEIGDVQLFVIRASVPVLQWPAAMRHHPRSRKEVALEILTMLKHGGGSFPIAVFTGGLRCHLTMVMLRRKRIWAPSVIDLVDTLLGDTSPETALEIAGTARTVRPHREEITRAPSPDAQVDETLRPPGTPGQHDGSRPDHAGNHRARQPAARSVGTVLGMAGVQCHLGGRRRHPRVLSEDLQSADHTVAG